MKKLLSSKHLIIIATLLLFFNFYRVTFGDDNTIESKEKEIYLTFDDGPSGKVTNDILDILKSEEVPATFFVIGNQIDNQEDIILRMRDEGHSIGLHSYTHERNNLYFRHQ